MNIAVYSGLDINGQGQILARWIRDHTSHKATNIVVQQTYLDYDADVLYRDARGQPTGAVVEDLDKLVDEYDFLILRWVSLRDVASLAAIGKLHAGNCIIKIHGSEHRYFPWEGLGFSLQAHGIMYVTNGYDFTLCRGLGFSVQHIPPMVDCDFIWAETQKQELFGTADGITVTHAPTDQSKKGTKYIKAAVKDLVQRGVRINLDLLSVQEGTQLRWIDAIRRKAKGHVLFDQISEDVGIGTFGLNLVEALAQSKIPLGQYSKYTYSVYPELRKYVVSARPAELVADVSSINSAIKARGAVMDANPAGREFCKRTFDVNVVAPRWVDLIEFASETLRRPRRA